MVTTADSLPDDIEALRALALNALAERDAAIGERNAATAERDRLIALNDRLRHLLRKVQGFDAKSERLSRLPPDQRNRTADDLAQPMAGTKDHDPADLVSVVRVILHYVENDEQ